MSLTSLIESLLQPVGFIWFGCLGAAIWGLARRRRAFAAFAGSIALVLHLVGGTTLPAWLLSRLEAPYDPKTHPLPPAGADAVVMLGGAHSYCARSLVGWNAGEPSDRILAAVELVRQGHAKVLVLGGAAYKRDGVERPDSEIIIRWLASWQVAAGEIIPLGICRDTRDEALKTAELARQRGWKRVIVVSSGYHLRRAEGVFRQTGLEVDMVGAEFLGLEHRDGGAWIRAVPDSEGFRHFNYWLHEELGLVYYRLKGWL